MVSSTIEALIVDLLEWLAKTDRSYEEVLDAWRTSCPRLTVWEDANDCGFIAIKEVNGRRVVRPSSLGLVFLQQAGRHP